jgi:CzcA family heavy metal efflux pump
MLNSLIYWSLTKRWLVLFCSFLLLAVSIYFLPKVPLEVFPELNAPTVTIMTEAPGFAAEEVETSVSFQIETALNGLPGLRSLRSSSTIGLSIIWAEFDFGADIYRNRQLIAEKLAQVKESLPENIHAPEMTPVTSIAGEIMLLGLRTTNSDISSLELRRIAEFELRPRLLAVSGVAQITVLGGELPEYQVQVHPDKLLLYGLTLKDIEEAARASHAPSGGGYLENVKGRELVIRPLTQAKSTEDIAKTVVGNWRGAPITLSQIAEIRLQGAPRRGTGSANGEQAVILTVQKNPGINTLKLTEHIDSVLDELQKSLKQGVEVKRDIFRQSDFIHVAIENVLNALRDGIIFVVLILILFLRNVRTTIITLTALPLSLGAALLILHAFGATINVMTLGGIAVAIGSLVDDAIVDVENVYRRLLSNSTLTEDQRKSTFLVVYEASKEVRSAITLATLIIVLVFLPLFFLTGVEGRFFRPLGAAYVISLGASLVVAMTITPVLCYLLLGKEKAAHRETKIVQKVKSNYSSLLQYILKKPVAVFTGAATLFIGSLLLASTYGSSFLPEFNEGSLTLFINTPIGTSLSESDRMGRQIEINTRKIPGVISVTRRTGRAEQDTHAEPVSASELDVRLSPEANHAAVQAALVDIFSNTPGVTAQIGGPIAHRLSHILSGTPAAVAIKIFADDLDVLRRVAKEIDAAIRPLPGVRDLVANREAMTVTLPVVFDREKLAMFGLTSRDAGDQIETAFLGKIVGVVNQGSSRIDIVVRLSSDARQSPEDVKSFVLKSPSGMYVPVKDVAKVFEEDSSVLITRENVKRKGVISCNVGEGYNLGDLITAIREKVEPLILKFPGTYVEYGGQFEAQEEASSRILWSSLAVLILIAGILYSAFHSFRAVLLILLNLPLALVGGVIALFVFDSPDIITNTLGLFGVGIYTPPVLSIPSLVGFIGLFGVACRNGLLLIAHYYHLMEVEMVPKETAVVQGAIERVIPILMTALCSALALIPLVIAKHAIGSELQYPVAVVMLGGLISSTILNLFVVPVGFLLFGGGVRHFESAK